MLNVLSLTLLGSGLPVVSVTVLLLIYYFFFVSGQHFKQLCSLFSQRGISLPTGVRGCVCFQF